MSAFYGMQGHARRGVAPGGAANLAQAIGSIVWDRVAPDSSYIPADGRLVGPTTYPEYTSAINPAPYPSVQLPNPATVPTGQCYPNSGPFSISDDGSWYVLYSTSGSVAIMVYNIINGVQIYAGTVTATYSIISISVSNNGDIAVYGTNQSTYYLSIFRRTAGQYTWTLQNTGGQVVTLGVPVWTSDSQYVLIPANGSPYTIVWKNPGNGGAFVNVIPSTIGLSSVSGYPTYINRSLNGERWIFYWNGLFYIFDYANGVFTQTSSFGFASALNPVCAPSFSADLNYFIIANAANVELWQMKDNGGYSRVSTTAFETSALIYVGFCGSDSYIFRFNTNASQDTVYQITGQTLKKISLGPMVPGESDHFGVAISRDGSTVVLSWTYQSGSVYPTTVLQNGTMPPVIAMPAMPPIGYGPNKQIPFVKVRS